MLGFPFLIMSLPFLIILLPFLLPLYLLMQFYGIDFDQLTIWLESFYEQNPDIVTWIRESIEQLWNWFAGLF